jgi:hypothetical protein
MYLYQNLKFDPTIQRTVEDTQYPAGWFLDPLERARIGVVEVADPVRPDDRFFTSVENPDGTYTATPRTAEDLAERHASEKAAFLSQVKAEAGYVTRQVLSGLDSEYELAEKEASAYKDVGYPADSIPESVKAEMDARGVTATVACDAILTAASGWRSAQASLRRNRLAAQTAAAASVDATGLDAIKENWATFMSSLRSSLGVS